MATDTSEKGLESFITNHLVSVNGYVQREFTEYDRELCLDLPLLFEFLESTHVDELVRLKRLHGDSYQQKIARRLVDRIKSKGVIEVLRKGIVDNGVTLKFLYDKPVSDLNPSSHERYTKNIFSVMRQLHFSQSTEQSLDLGIFINGIPVITFELKNELTKQSYKDAILQYKQDRSPREPLFGFGRCIVHFAVDTEQVYMTTRLMGDKTYFLPFNKGSDHAAGNPVNPNGIMTSYLWEDILTKDSLTNLVENFASLVEETDEDDKKIKKLLFPRYHQLDVVLKLLASAQSVGAGRRYLIQHSAGSGKSNSIAWLAHQLVDLHDKSGNNTIFDTIIVVTDRTVLNSQIGENLRQFTQVDGVFEDIDKSSKQLKEALQDGKKIISTTIQKFPYILADLGTLPSSKFAVIIDEAHSSQSGESSHKLNQALSGANGSDEEEKTDEDRILEAIQSRKMLDNVSYFAFTATPKNKTLELFGDRNSDGKPVHFHIYSMKQAIEEGFILDVLKNYTTYHTYFKLIKSVEDDPEYDKQAAKRKIAKFIGTDERTIEKKALVMLDHFMNAVLATRKINGHAKSMVVTASRKSAVEYKKVFDRLLAEKNIPFKALVAYSGKIDGKTEDALNDYSVSGVNDIKKSFRHDDYRFLIVANKFQTGFDQPLLHTMYVDKQLHGVMAVQTLSRLNRTKYPYKKDTFVLDFTNESADIQASFEPFYKTTMLADTTDPNQLFDIKDALADYQLYTNNEIEHYASLILDSAPVNELHAMLDVSVARFKQLGKDEQYDVIAKVKTLTRMYAFLSQIIPFESIELERLYIFLNHIKDKLRPEKADDTTADLLSNIDLDSYRVQLIATQNIALAGDAELAPLGPDTAGGGEVEIDSLSGIVKSLNEQFGDIEFRDSDKLKRTFAELSEEVRNDKEYIRATEGTDKQNSWITFQKVLQSKFHNKVTKDFDLYKKYNDDKAFHDFISEELFEHLWNQTINKQ
jgi:type I restriction enzyme R subunit